MVNTIESTGFSVKQNIQRPEIISGCHDPRSGRLETRLPLALHQRSEGRLPGDQLAVLLGRPVDGGVGWAPGVKLAHPGTIQPLISPQVHTEQSAVPAIVSLSVGAPGVVPGAALQAPVDDHGGGPEARDSARLVVGLVGAPGALHHRLDARLGRLRRHEEPEGGGEVEPGAGHEVGVVEQGLRVPEHRDTERSVVVIPAELLGAAAVVLLAGAAGVGRTHPGAPGGAVRGLGDLLDVKQARSLLLEMCENCRQSLWTEFRIRADRRKLSNGL